MSEMVQCCLAVVAVIMLQTVLMLECFAVNFLYRCSSISSTATAMYMRSQWSETTPATNWLNNFRLMSLKLLHRMPDFTAVNDQHSILAGAPTRSSLTALSQIP